MKSNKKSVFIIGIFIICIILLFIVGAFFVQQNKAQNDTIAENDQENRYLGDNSEEKYFWNTNNLKPYIDDAFLDFEEGGEEISKRSYINNYASSLLKKDNNFDGDFSGVLDHGGDTAGSILEKDEYIYSFPVNNENSIHFKFWVSLYNALANICEIVKNSKESVVYNDLKDTIEKYKDGTYEDHTKTKFFETFDVDKYVESINNDKNLNELRNKLANGDYELTPNEENYLVAVYSDCFQAVPPMPDERKYEIANISFMNGNSLSIDEYYNNARAKKVKVVINNSEYMVDLDDTPEVQNIPIGWTSSNDEYKKPIDVSIEILEIYDGDISNDVYFSGVFVDVEQNFVSFGI